MGDTNPTNAATPPAASGGITLDQVNTAIASALKPLSEALAGLSTSVKTITETQAAQQQQQQAAATKKEEAKPLTIDDVNKAITSAFTQQQTTAQQQSARQQFIDTRLKNFPAAYQQKLGNDPAKFEEQAKSIADEYKADGAKFGFKVQDVAGENPGGQSPVAATPDLSKLSPTELVTLGLNQKAATTGATKAA